MNRKMVQFTPGIHDNVVRQRKLRHQNYQQYLSVPSKATRIEGVEPSYRGTFFRSFREYLLNATLHGLKYMGDGTISLFERYKIQLM